MHFKYYTLCLVNLVSRLVPVRVGYFIADRGGDIFYHFSRKRRANIAGNIQRVMDQKEDPATLRRQVRCVFRNAAKNYFDLTRLAYVDLDNLDGRVKIEGLDNLSGAASRGKGVVLATAHLGNFETSAHIVASRGYDMTIPVEAYEDTPFLRKLAGLRSGKRVRIVPVGVKGIKECLQTLHRGGIVTIVCDRDLQGNGIKAEFFGKPTSFPPGPVDLAMRTGAVVVPCFSLRGPKNTTRIYFEPPLKMSDNENHDQALKANLASLVAVMEKYIRQYPDQWVVLEPI